MIAKPQPCTLASVVRLPVMLLITPCIKINKVYLALLYLAAPIEVKTHETHTPNDSHFAVFLHFAVVCGQRGNGRYCEGISFGFKLFSQSFKRGANRVYNRHIGVCHIWSIG